MKRAATAVRARGAGFTLLELLIAISLMAVLAVLGWRGLDSVLNGRERVVEASDSLRALSVGFTQLEEDLRRAWPVRLLNLQLPVIGFVALEDGATPALQVVRESPPGIGMPQLQRVVYRLHRGALERGFTPWVNPVAANAEGGTATAWPQEIIWQPLVVGLTGLQMRAWIAGQGWVPASALALRSAAGGAGVTPTGVEVLVQRASGERIVRVLAVKD